MLSPGRQRAADKRPMIVLSHRFDKLDTYIADAALGQCSWTEALTSMAKMVGADGLSMDLVFGDNRMVRSLGAVGFDPAMVQAYSDHYHRIDPRIIHAQRYASHGVIFDEELRRPDTPDEHAEFWEWLERSNAPTEASMLVMPCIGDARIGLAVHRERGRNDHTDVVQFYQRFYDKFNAINQALRRRGQPVEGASDAIGQLQHIDCFTLVVDENMRLAEGGFEPHIPYTLSLTGLARLGDDGELCDILPDLHSALIAMLQNAFPQEGVDVTLKTALADSMVRIAPLPQTAGPRMVQMRVTYMRHAAAAEKIFMGAFGLTRRQAELLDVLRRVHALDEAAAQMAISRNTARVFLAQIFERTGIRRKVDLLRLADSFA